MIPTVKEPESLSFWGSENCCFCHQITPFWTNLPGRTPGQQVACCKDCAGIFPADVVPTKTEWCDYWRERDRAAGRMLP